MKIFNKWFILVFIICSSALSEEKYVSDKELSANDFYADGVELKFDTNMLLEPVNGLPGVGREIQLKNGDKCVLSYPTLSKKATVLKDARWKLKSKTPMSLKVSSEPEGSTNRFVYFKIERDGKDLFVQCQLSFSGRKAIDMDVNIDPEKDKLDDADKKCRSGGGRYLMVSSGVKRMLVSDIPPVFKCMKEVKAPTKSMFTQAFKEHGITINNWYDLDKYGEVLGGSDASDSGMAVGK